MSRRWSVLAGAWAVYAAFGLLVSSTGALVPQIRDDLNLSDSVMGLVLGAWQLIYIGTAIPAGRVLDRFGIRRALLASMVIMLASGFGRAIAWDGWSLFASVALLGLGAPIISVGAPKVAASLFEGADRRLAVGIYSTAPVIGGALGLVLPANVVGPLVDDDWRLIIAVLTGFAAVALVIWVLVSGGLDGLLAPGAGPSLSEYRSIAALPVVRFVLFLSVLNFYFVHGVGQWVVAILDSAGWSPREAGLWAAFGTLGSLIASYVIPRMATSDRRPALMVGVMVAGAGSLFFLLSTQVLLLAPSLLVATIARSALVPLLIMVMMDHPDVGPERIAAATGLFFALAQIGGVTGPTLTGVLADASDGFRLPLLVHSGVALSIAFFIIVGYRRATA
ncbi:MAG: MFS transporter [Actinomycetota bacterium]